MILNHESILKSQILPKSKLLLFLVFAVFLINVVDGMAQEIKPDSLSCYPWLCPEYNYVQFYNKSDLKAFSDKWNTKNTALITIAHFGDSHVQPDVYPGQIRKRLQSLKGDAGFGMIFPFSTAKAVSTVDYKSIHTGIWSNAKSIQHSPALPLGISGATSRTTDSHASFTIIFANKPPQEYRKLKLFFKQYQNSFAIRVISGGRESFIDADTSRVNKQPFVEITLPAIGDSIKVQLEKTHPSQNEFEFYGMSLESIKPVGVMLHCMGIGGAQYGSILWESLFDEQLPGIHPDLAILDFGTNDFLYNNKIAPDLESQILKIIHKVRADAPNCTVLLTSAMDMNHKGQNITAGAKFSKLIRKIAREQHCPFYDWYWISGGPGKMTSWHDNGLAHNDNIHLKVKGSVLKGQLFADAIINTMALFKGPASPDSMVLSTPEIKDSELAIIASSTLYTPNERPNNSGKSAYISYKVHGGESLGSIAGKFHVTVSAIQKLNGMKSTKIIAGKTLKIPGKAKTSKRHVKAKGRKGKKSKRHH